jgi:hypothetical protein
MDMVKRIYTDTPEALYPMAERSVIAALELLEASGHAIRTPPEASGGRDVWTLSAP